MMYVDNWKTPYGRLKMSRMIADTRAELIAFSHGVLGLKKEYIHYPGTWREHIEIAQSKRKLAIANGAISMPATVLFLVARALKKQDLTNWEIKLMQTYHDNPRFLVENARDREIVQSIIEGRLAILAQKKY